MSYVVLKVPEEYIVRNESGVYVTFDSGPFGGTIAGATGPFEELGVFDDSFTNITINASTDGFV